MSKTKHTQGPWRRNARRDRLGQHHVYGRPHPIDGGDYAPICTTRNPEDADLIAAAPDLLEAAEAALAYFEQCVMSCDPEDEEVKEAAMLRAAIKKAKGEAE